MDAESAIQSYLSAALAGAAEVSADRPSWASPGEPRVTYERTGGSYSDCLDSAVVAVQCWASTRSAAKALAYEVRGLLEAMPDAVPGAAVGELVGPYNFPDGGNPRYQLTAEVYC